MAKAIGKAIEQPATENPMAAKRPGDRWIWGIYVVLCFISLVESYSASSQEVAKFGLYMPMVKHAGLLLLGGFLAWGLQNTNYNKFRAWIPLFTLFTLGCVIYVMFCGDIINGARRSFRIPGIGFSVQPSEMAKLSLVTVIAWIMSKMQIPGGGVKMVAVVVCAFLVLLFGGLLLPQGFTNTAILMAISLAMMLIAGVQFKRFLIILVVYGGCYGGYKAITHVNKEKEMQVEATQAARTESDESREDARSQRMGASQTAQAAKTVNRDGTRSKRIESFSFFESDCLKHSMSSEYQQEQYGYMARAHGGLMGVGPGNSRECSRLPLAFSDYVFSIIVEELGFAGAIALMALYISLLGRAGIIASKCKRAFPALLILGMAVMITVQALSHMAINSGLVPVTGQPLPFISKGGSSILVMSIAMGIMLSVSRFAEFNSGKKPSVSAEKAAEAEGDAINPSQIIKS